ncbi:glucokinase-like ROK family protein [Caldalkalibacillus uzonensis]|uniref:Glucokinase-like ROK family protein n=1 Tax=Caldalkalibacillus uzonensis TaxID=353224 RepID=A0ABU0CQI3_9BACI|nr:ROK family transcriptional regulator [Caldalkalibacillus uzonensis]MDQ0338679.1 glucokinase-like ROK family protein [Caldalkalibacillus uzonensis]
MKAVQSSREINTKRVIKLIREEGPLSRVEISERMDIPQPTITRIIEELLKENVLKEVGLGVSKGGRRPVLLGFNHQCYYAFGVELGRSKIKVALTDLEGNFLSLRMKETQPTEKISSILDYIHQTLEAILQETSVDRHKILGVGVGLPGPLNENEQGCISPPNFYNEKEIPLRAMLQDILQFPVIIDNDANVAALAEKWFGQGIGVNNFMYIMADVGIGSGIVIDGELHRGLFGESGEIGHSTIDVYGEKCSCGNYGCLETFSSLPKVVERFRKKLKLAMPDEPTLVADVDPETIHFEDIVAAACNGSHLAQQTIQEAGQYLGVGIANAVNLLAPELVIVGGKLSEGRQLLRDAIQSTLRVRALGISGKRIPVVLSGFKEGVVLGASALVINETFSLFSNL